MKLDAFVPTLDLPASVAFYTGVLGLRVVHQHQFGAVLDSDGVAVRVTPVAELRPQPFTVLGWQVEGLDAAVADLVAAGVDLVRYEGMGQDDTGIWTTPDRAARVAWFHDPDGNLLSFTQPL